MNHCGLFTHQSLMQSWRQLNLVLVTGSLSTTGIGVVSAILSQGQGASIQYRRGKELCLPLFVLLLFLLLLSDADTMNCPLAMTPCLGAS